MNFRSTNPEGHVHYGGDIMSGANSTLGVLLSSNTVSPVSDNTNENLILKGKGTGGVQIGASTSAFTGIGRGASTTPVIALAASGMTASTITIPGLATGDVLYIGRPTPSTTMSTVLAMAGAWASGANEGSFYVLNNVASTASIIDGSFPYFYIKA